MVHPYLIYRHLISLIARWSSGEPSTVPLPGARRLPRRLRRRREAQRRRARVPSGPAGQRLRHTARLV